MKYTFRLKQEFKDQKSIEDVLAGVDDISNVSIFGRSRYASAEIPEDKLPLVKDAIGDKCQIMPTPDTFNPYDLSHKELDRSLGLNRDI